MGPFEMEAQMLNRDIVFFESGQQVLFKAGVIDPKKVTRIALQNAASVAGLLLTTECAIAEKPQPASAAGMPGMPGGMGGMY